MSDGGAKMGSFCHALATEELSNGAPKLFRACALSNLAFYASPLLIEAANAIFLGYSQDYIVLNTG